MWSDNETEIDLLGFEHLVTAVTSIVNNEALLPATIGVYGDWGSGKSSLLKMISHQFEGQDGVLLLSFNGWLFEGFDDAKTALMGTILDEIISRRLVSTEMKDGASASDGSCSSRSMSCGSWASRGERPSPESPAEFPVP